MTTVTSFPPSGSYVSEFLPHAPVRPDPRVPAPSFPTPAAPLLPPSGTSAIAHPFYGRSASEYLTSFGLLPSHDSRPHGAGLLGRAILDVGAGPASFTAEMHRRGAEIAAVDPLYGCPLENLATHVQLDYARVSVEAARRLSGDKLRAREALEQDRRAAAQRFLADYESGFLHNRYVGGALPRLPFLDRSFDLVLCGHVLSGPLSPFSPPHVDTLLAACRELVRVSAGEVRIYPFNGLPLATAAALLATLATEGIVSERQTVSRQSTRLILRRGICGTGG